MSNFQKALAGSVVVALLAAFAYGVSITGLINDAGWLALTIALCVAGYGAWRRTNDRPRFRGSLYPLQRALRRVGGWSLPPVK